MVDYIAIEKVEADVLDAISIGLCKGAKLAGISISGGETAQLRVTRYVALNAGVMLNMFSAYASVRGRGQKMLALYRCTP